VPPKIPRLLWLLLPLAWVIYFQGLSATGLFGPDEPRYAAIGREMARSGDWITPRLWGEPWFEKPALLYWMTATGFRLGLGPETAPRVPVAILSIAFLAFYWWVLNAEFGCRAAWMATMILGSCVAWIGFSQAGVTDLPLAATFSAAMLLAVPWIAKRDTRNLPLASAMLGFAVLAKGLVPLVLAAPLLLRWRAWRDLLRPAVILPFVAVSLPWYALCYARNGRVFVDTFFVQHQFGRFVSNALQHVQPWWFYLPVFAALLLPWTPLLVLAFRRKLYSDARRIFLLVWVVFGLVFFSAAANKLPGYLLPLLPAAAALLALALDNADAPARFALAACALLLAVFPVAAPLLPVALADGLSRAPRPSFHPSWLLPLAAALAVWLLERKGRRMAAVVVVTAGCGLCVGYLKTATLPELDRLASARTLARTIVTSRTPVCSEIIGRDWRYGLSYYTGSPLPACTGAEGMRLVQGEGPTPHLVLGRAP
jgi:4-amino-4-deoxy-L-arabinose transferase-like glycosyltransferase